MGNVRPSRDDRRAAACLILLVGAVCGRCDAARAGAGGGDDAAPTAGHCQVAIVNPVSGNAECVEPRGAPVDPPPPRPPPSKQTCRKHRDLELKDCPQTPPRARSREDARLNAAAL
jgi:hypothetical protein